MQRAICGYHLDEDNHWVAELDCGHFQHVRHNPPWQERFWVTTEFGRLARMGHLLACKKCDQGAPADNLGATHKGEMWCRYRNGTPVRSGCQTVIR